MKPLGRSTAESAQVAKQAPLFGGAATADRLEVCSNYIGVYWTFPAPGRPRLPAAADVAARESFTIDEQRRRIRRQAHVRGLRCVGEYAIQFHEPEISDDDRTRLREINSICEDGETAILLTKFTQSHNWRRNTLLDAILRNTGAPVVHIEPSGAVIDHFLLNRHWERCRLEIRRAKVAAKEAISSKQELKSFRSGKINKIVSDRFYDYFSSRLNDVDSPDNATIANRFNSLNLYTLRGHKWDADAVRALRATLARRCK